MRDNELIKLSNCGIYLALAILNKIQNLGFEHSLHI